MIFAFLDFELDSRLFELRRDRSTVAVQPKVLDVLGYLIRHRDRVVSKQELLERVWPDEIVSETALTHAVMEARRAVEDDGTRQQIILTVRRRGYRFIARVEERPGRVEERRDAARAERTGPEPASMPRQTLPSLGSFVGRDRILAQLRACLEEALAGRGRVVLLVGEPGIGKTRTAEEFAAQARATRAEVLLGRCVEAEGAPAYWPWVQIVRSWVQERDQTVLEEMLGSRAAVIGQAMPEVGERLPGIGEPPELDAEQARFRLFDSLTTVFKRAAEKRPLVMVIDDLQRADRASLLLLQFLARELRDAAILVIGTYRDAELGRDPMLSRILGEIIREDPSRLLSLEGLTRSDVGRFLEQVLQRPPPERRVAALHEQTGGNPFFLTQLVQLLEAEGRLEQADDASSWEVPLTQGVRDAIRRHLDILSEDCQEALVAASVVGHEFPLAALVGATGCDADPLLESLGEAIQAHVVAEVPGAVGRYRFSHSLVRETLYGELAPARRVQLHRRVGEALAALYGVDVEAHLAELAYHFVQAAPGGDSARAIDYSVRAAERAAAQLAYEEAIAHYERALEVLRLAPGDERQRCELLIALGRAHWQAGEGEQAREAYLKAGELAQRLGDAGAVARAALGLGLWDQDDLVDDLLVRLLEEAQEGLPEEDSGLRARVLGRLARELRFTASWERLTALSQESVAMARRVGDTAALADALVARHWALWGPENTEDRFAAAVEIVELAEQIHAPALALQGRQFRLADLLELGDISGVDGEIEAVSLLADELQRPQHQWFATLYRAMRAHMSGRLDEAESLAQEALGIGERVHRETAVGWYGVQLAAIRRERGQLEAAATALEIFRRQFPWVSTWRCKLALTKALLGHEEEARAEFEELASRDFANLRRDVSWLTSISFLAETSALLGDAARADVLYGLLLPFESRVVSISPGVACHGSAARYLGLLAATVDRHDEAVAHFERALAANTRMGARPFVAHTQHDWAAMLLKRGRTRDRRQARQLAEQALATAQSLEMRPLAGRAAALTKALRSPRRTRGASR